MNIDIIVAQLVKKGFTETRAKDYAGTILTVANENGVNPIDLIDNLSKEFKLNDLGEFLVNNTKRRGYATGKITNREPNKYVARAIIK